MTMPTLAQATAWLGAALVVVAGSVPMTHRLLFGRRAALDSRPIRSHVVIGVSAAAASFAHSIAILPDLGSPTAIGAGVLALAPGAVAFLLLLAHVGVGLKLRSPKLRGRAKTRRTHLAFACSIAIAITVHVVMILRART